MNLYEIKYTIIFNGEEDSTTGRVLKAANKELAMLKFRERCPKSLVIGDSYCLIENRINSITEYKIVSIDTDKDALNA